MVYQRVLISADLEGVAGVVASEELRTGNPEYETAQRLMTGEVNAAVRGVRAADSSAEVVVADSHGSYRNLLVEQLHPEARLLRGRPRTLAMVHDAERADAVIFIGYHARAGRTGVLSHTFSDVIRDVRCNGQSLGEAGLNAAVASHFGAPLLLATGDDALVHEIRDLAPGAATVSVKRAVSAFAAESLHPSVACEQIEAAARAATQRGAGGVVMLPGPITLEVDLTRPGQADQAEVPPPLQRLGPVTVGVTANDVVQAYRWVRTIVALASATP